MNFRKIIYTFSFCLAICFGSLISVAQTDSVLLKKADRLYDSGDIKEALKTYSSIVSRDSNNLRANFMTGICYIESANKAQSLSYFKKALELSPAVSPKILYYIAYASHLGYQFDTAIDYYRRYLNTLTDKANTSLSAKEKKDERTKALKLIAECETGKQLVANPDTGVKIKNLGPVINSIYPDYGPIITPDEKYLYFTSKREGSTGGMKDRKTDFFEDIYFSEHTDSGWTKPQPLDSAINTDLHESCIAISSDGTELYLYIDNDQNKGDIFHSKMIGNTWTKPQPFSIMINTEHIENSMTLSQDGLTIFFSSNKPGGIGGKDIYMSKKKKSGGWETPQNLGYDINTEHDEEGPFLAADGKTMYFSSKGHAGMGGYDLFKSVYDSVTQKWSAPENLGYPINSTDDDIYFTLAGSGKYGYFASVKDEGMGDLDIYRILMPGFTEEDTTLIAMSDSVGMEDTDSLALMLIASAVELHIKIFDRDNDTPLDAKIEVFSEKGKFLYKGQTKNGSLKLPIKENAPRNLLVALQKDGYIFKTVSVNVPTPEEFKQIVDKSIFMDKVAVGVRTILSNIYFDFDMATLKSSSDIELHKLRRLLAENPTLKIRIDGHTDNIGSSQYNKELSHRRAKAVVTWLINHGITASRLSSKGYGQEVPLASNDDEEEGRELNRRTEFVILEY